MPMKMLAIAVSLSGLASVSHAAATKDDAVNMVKLGAAFIIANGRDKGHAAITRTDSPFKKDDLYLVVYGLDGTVRAHGANDKMVGKNLIDLKDIDGKSFVKERVELARTQSAFWQDYKFTHPISKKIEFKTMYCERLDDAVVCGGIYK